MKILYFSVFIARVSVATAVVGGAPACLAANANNPYGHIDPRNDAGNDTGDAQVEALNQSQIDDGPRQAQPLAPGPDRRRLAQRGYTYEPQDYALPEGYAGPNGYYQNQGSEPEDVEPSGPDPQRKGSYAPPPPYYPSGSAGYPPPAYAEEAEGAQQPFPAQAWQRPPAYAPPGYGAPPGYYAPRGYYAPPAYYPPGAYPRPPGY